MLIQHILCAHYQLKCSNDQGGLGACSELALQGCLWKVGHVGWWKSKEGGLDGAKHDEHMKMLLWQHMMGRATLYQKRPLWGGNIGLTNNTKKPAVWQAQARSPSQREEQVQRPWGGTGLVYSENWQENSVAGAERTRKRGGEVREVVGPDLIGPGGPVEKFRFYIQRNGKLSKESTMLEQIVDG